jgi:hypothetical protein
MVTVLLLAVILPASAQDDSMEGMIHCDSTLISLLFVAEYSYGFHSMMDVSTFDKGQYAPLFESMMSMMDDEMMDEDMAADDEMMEDDMAADDMMMEDDMMMLSPGVIEDEAAECTELRAEVEGFLYDHFSMMMMAEDSM